MKGRHWLFAGRDPGRSRARGQSSGVTPQLLVKDDQITELQKKGMRSVRETTIVLNCPIIQIGK